MLEIESPHRLRLAAAAMAIAAMSAGTASADPQPPPYSLPWQLRPLSVGNVLRSDTSVAFYQASDPAGGSQAGSTVSTMLLATYKLTPELAPLVRLALVHNEAPPIPDGPPSATALANPLLGVAYAVQRLGVRWAAFGAATLPVGQGGGADPDPGDAESMLRAIPARSAMDNAMFATNYLSVIGGLGAGIVARGFTGQLEVTVLQLFRARGPEGQDARRTNLTAGLHAGVFALPWLSVGGELRYQRWLTDAAPVQSDGAARETVTVGVGPRLHLRIDETRWIRPGISYSRALDAPLSSADYQMLQLDVPFLF